MMAGRSLDRLGIDFSWSDFAAFIRYAPTTSQLSAAVHGYTPWSTEAVLLASLLDAVRGGNWQRGNGKGPRPKPTKVPGYESPDTVYGTPKPIDEVRDYLMARNGRAPTRR